MHPGMGAILHKEGCTFRVWAPHANAVKVRIAAYCNGEASLTDLAPEENGYWAIDVAGVNVGDAYKFVLDAAGTTFEHKDPYARQVTNSAGVCIVVDPQAFDWQGVSFEMPPHNELVIYEMHIGSFVVADGETGHFDVALDRLAHLKQLGVNAIQIMPVAEFAGDRSWGYNPADIFAVESAYGGATVLRPSFAKLTGRASPSFSTSSSIISAPVISTCGVSMGGRRTTEAASTSTTITVQTHHGVEPDPIMVAVRCGSSYATT